MFNLDSIIEMYFALSESNNTKIDKAYIVEHTSSKFHWRFVVNSVGFNFYAEKKKDSIWDVEVLDDNGRFEPTTAKKYDASMWSGALRGIKIFTGLYKAAAGIRFSSPFESLQKLYNSNIFKTKIEQLTPFVRTADKPEIKDKYLIWTYLRK